MAKPRPSIEDGPDTTFLDRPARFAILRGLADGEDELPRDNERYRFEGAIGRGGSARVFRARDLILDRPVALKIFPPGYGDLNARRLREARTQARVRHDDVMPIYETGELDGRPFLAMPLIDGYVLGGLPAEVSLDETVRLSARVARALHAAHRQGLVHRDVKPSNVLVERTGDGELKPYVADFGISAELHQDHPLEIAGTPAYMAPEQLSGSRVDRRTDVFGLGATLYHVFTGRPPFVETPRSWRRGEPLPPHEPPPRPRAVRPDLPVELEAVILRAMAADPAERYPTARAVAEDLERYLAGDVVSAHAAGWAYRLTKLVLRHRWVAALVAVAGLVALGALTAAAVSGVREAAAHQRAASRQARAEELLSFLLGDLRQQLEPIGRLDLLDEVSGEAEEYFRALPADELSEDETARRAEALHQLGDLRLRRGDVPAARTAFEQSLGLAERLARHAPDAPDRLFELGQSLFWLAHAHEREGDLDAAEPYFRRYLEVSRELLAAHPDYPGARQELAYAYGNLASLRERQGRLADAHDLLADSLTLKQAHAAADPADPDRRRDLAVTHNKLGVVLQELGRLDEAEEQLRQEWAIRRELAERQPQHTVWRSELASSHNYVASLLRLRERPAEALVHYREAVTLLGSLVDLEPDHVVWRFQWGVNLSGLGMAEVETGRRASGLARLAESHGLFEELVAADPSFAAARLVLGRSHRQLGAVLPSREHLEQSVAVYRAIETDSRGGVSARIGRVTAELALGDLEAAEGRPEAAREAWRRAAELAGSRSDPRLSALGREVDRRFAEPNPSS